MHCIFRKVYRFKFLVSYLNFGALTWVVIVQFPIILWLISQGLLLTTVIKVQPSLHASSISLQYTDICKRPVRKVFGNFLISREPVQWPWWNLAVSQRRPYCASVNNHSPVGLVSWQWDAVHWVCVLWQSYSQISSLSKAILALGKARGRREPNLGCMGADRAGWCEAPPQTPPKKNPSTRTVEWTGALTRRSWSARSVIMNAKVTQYTSSVNGVSLPTD